MNNLNIPLNIKITVFFGKMILISADDSHYGNLTTLKGVQVALKLAKWYINA